MDSNTHGYQVVALKDISMSLSLDATQLGIHAPVFRTDVSFPRYDRLIYPEKGRPKITECPTRYRTRHFINNFTTNEDIATKSEADLPHCIRNVTTS